MATAKNYANGVFAKEFEAQYGMMISLGIRRDDFIAWLEGLEENEKGYINLTMGPNKEAPGWSVWEYVADRQTSTRAPRPTAKPAARTTTKSAPVDDGEDSLPF